MTKRVFIGNMSYSMTNDELREAFSPYRPIAVKVVFDRDTGKSRGFGFVECETEALAKQALEMNGVEALGRQLVVKEAEEKPRLAQPQSQNRHDRNGGGGNSGGGQKPSRKKGNTGFDVWDRDDGKHRR